MATSSQDPDIIEQFVAVTGAARHVAVSMLEACSGNLDLAVGMHMDGGGGEASMSSSAERDSGATASANHQNIGEEEDEVRAPIPQKTEVLVEEDGSKFAAWRMRRPRRAARSVFDGFRDFQAEARNFENSTRGKTSSKKRNLEDLFRPPVDITHKGTLQTARDIGSSQNRWVLVNVQNVQEFSCQTLNRDVWSCQKVRDIIKENFVFWQVYNDSEEGRRFMQFYKVNEWPHIAIIDPVTGENQIVWHKVSDGAVFCDLAKDFLSVQSVPDESQSQSPAKRARRDDSIVDASEHDQMEAAIQASLRVNQAVPNSPQYVMDSDSEADVIQDSGDDDVETFSDSDDLLVSNSRSKGPSSSASSSSRNGDAKKSSQTSTSRQSPSSLCSRVATATRSEKVARSPRKDNLSRCKNLSAAATQSCNYSPRSLVSEEAGSSSSNGSGGSSLWLPSEASSSSSHTTISPLRVDVDDGEPHCADLASPSVIEKDMPSTSRDTDGECHEKEDRVSDWKEFWGQESDPFSKIMLRLPDNRRQQIELPCSSSLKALKVWCSSNGFPPDKYEMVTNFPRRKLSEMCEQDSLKDIGLFPQETVFVQDL